MDETAESEIQRTVDAFYAAFDNRDGRVPSVANFRALFRSDARVTRVSADRIDAWGVDDFFAPRATMLTDGTLREFHEWETSGKTTAVGRIASRESRYRKIGVLNGARYIGEGRKLIQLCRAGDRWLIVSVLWEDEVPR